MKNISDVDKNMQVQTKIGKDDLALFAVKDGAFGLCGLLEENGFRRIPEEVANRTSEGVQWLHRCTAGGRLRFLTDSSYIALSCTLRELHRMANMPSVGRSGFAVYADGIYAGSVFPASDATDRTFAGVVEFGSKKMRQIVIYFPDYSAVDALFLGLQKGAKAEDMPPYRYQKPVVFYGSSITQGGTVSKSGNDYEAILSRNLDFDYINLGFSGNAKGEQVMADYIASLSMAAFVMDYDHNAPNPEHLQKTHQPFFETIRKAQPNLPILLVTKPDRAKVAEESQKENEKRVQIVRATFEAARAKGDQNVWFLDGKTFFDIEDADCCTTDGCHPNDLGHWCMAQKLKPILKEMLEKTENR